MRRVCTFGFKTKTQRSFLIPKDFEALIVSIKNITFKILGIKDLNMKVHLVPV
jgi:hypothetical protein